MGFIPSLSILNPVVKPKKSVQNKKLSASLCLLSCWIGQKKTISNLNQVCRNMTETQDTSNENLTKKGNQSSNFKQHFVILQFTAAAAGL